MKTMTEEARINCNISVQQTYPGACLLIDKLDDDKKQYLSIWAQGDDLIQACTKNIFKAGEPVYIERFINA